MLKAVDKDTEFSRKKKMETRNKKLIASWEIFLLVSLSFAIAFIFSESSVSAQTEVAPWTVTPSGNWIAPTGEIYTSAELFPSAAGTQTITAGGATTPGAAAAASGGGATTAAGTGAATTSGIDIAGAGGVLGQTAGGATIVSAGTPIASGAVLGPGTVLGQGSAVLSNGVILQTGQAVPTGLTATVTSQTATIGGTSGSVAAQGSGLNAFTGSIAPKTAASPTLMQSFFGGKAFGAGFGGALFSGLVWGAVIGIAGYFIADMLGLEDPESVGLGLGVGGAVGVTSYLYGANMAAAGTPLTGGFSTFATSAFGATLIGVGIAAVIIIATYTEQKQELVRFECLPWEAPLGGSQCEVCNDNPWMPCSEYRCKSLGQGCELINKGSTEEACVWVTKGDTAAPHITPSDEALSPVGLKYTPDPTVSPPNRGFKILGADSECLQAFTKLEFGITTDEPAQCKIDYSPKATYDEMQYFVGSSNLFLEENVQKLKVPSPFTEEGDVVPEIGQDGTYTLWTRCIDSNGNGQDSAMVAFRFCVKPGPDTTQPTIEGSSIRTNSFVRFNADAVPIELYVNEPAECKWSRQDKDFDSMENKMNCATETYQINSNLDYVCEGSLSGIQNTQDNLFYFRCKDYSRAPGGRNVMTSSFPVVLKGTQQLTIKSVGPKGEFSGTTTVIPVTLSAETSHGAEDGKATCYFSINGADSSSFIPMGNTKSYLHNQSLDLPTGTYNYHFRCVDAGGNSADANTTFTVFTDTTAPGITRAYKDGTSLKVITNEDATCYYSETSCTYNIEDGLPMSKEDPQVLTSHSIAWKEGISYHIKCVDNKGNQPRPDFCQIIAKASEL